MLPVLNREAVDLAIRAGKALSAEIARVSRFDRKHYFYPDLPKGYQTTQMYQPIILAGFVDAPCEDGSTVHVRIHHAHMEEDAGKLTHYADYSLVDLNRAGTPLIEIVSEPDIHSAAEAKAYAMELYLRDGTIPAHDIRGRDPWRLVSRQHAIRCKYLSSTKGCD